MRVLLDWWWQIFVVVASVAILAGAFYGVRTVNARTAQCTQMGGVYIHGAAGGTCVRSNAVIRLKP